MKKVFTGGGDLWLKKSRRPVKIAKDSRQKTSNQKNNQKAGFKIKSLCSRKSQKEIRKHRHVIKKKQIIWIEDAVIQDLHKISPGSILLLIHSIQCLAHRSNLLRIGTKIVILVWIRQNGIADVAAMGGRVGLLRFA